MAAAIFDAKAFVLQPCLVSGLIEFLVMSWCDLLGDPKRVLGIILDSSLIYVSDGVKIGI
jgi:hypothetical protein